DMQAREGGDCAGCADEEIITLLTTMVAQRELSSADYDSQGRITDAEREREEIEILSEFLPRPLAGDALKNAVRDVVQTLGASKLTDVGKCMSVLRQRYPGQIECSEAGKEVRSALS
ncbi:MAG: GatB/YqeY domain-containing protein, partial [Pseudomonadota bacterium]